MNPLVVLYGFIGFLVCLCLHILIWQLRRPSNDALMLFVVFIIIPVIIFIPVLILSGSNARFMSLLPVEIVAVLFLHLSLSVAYIASYPAAQASSPTLEILLIAASAMPEGLTRKDIIRYFDDAKLLSQRFQDLLNLKLMVEGRGTFVLTPTARFIIRFFVLFRRMLGLQIRGG